MNSSSSPDARLARSKARIYQAFLKDRQGDSAQARQLLGTVIQDSPDWRDRTYASHWLQTFSHRRPRLRKGVKPGRSGWQTAAPAPAFGGVGYPRPEDRLGNPDNKPPGNCGAPGWDVNLLNLNFYLSDTPLWYESPVGPSVAITLSFNSLSAISRHEPFGNKWQFNYATYLDEDLGGQVTVFMPDGRRDLYVPDGTGGYTPPFQVFNTLQKIGPQNFELTFRDDTVFVYQIPGNVISLQPVLTEIRDANGQKLLFGHEVSRASHLHYRRPGPGHYPDLQQRRPSHEGERSFRPGGRL